MEITQGIEIAATSDRVWSILDDQFGEIATWAARMLDSEVDDALGELGGRRVTTVEYGPAAETLYRRDGERRSLGYWVTGPSLPPPISDVQTEWRVADLDGEGCSVDIRFLAIVSNPEAQPMLEQMLRDGMTPLLQELKYYVETGDAHPNKSASGGGE